MSRTQISGLSVATVLHDFLVSEALPGTGVTKEAFSTGSPASSCCNLAPKNRELLSKRDELQAQIDAWHRRARRGRARSRRTTGRSCRRSAICAEPDRLRVADAERRSGDRPSWPARSSSCRCRTRAIALNAANARWGSLYDALYGTDALRAPTARRTGYDPARGAQGDRAGRAAFLDEPRRSPAARTPDASGYAIGGRRRLVAPRQARSADPAQFVGCPATRKRRRRAAAPQRPARRNPDRPHAIRSARTTRPASPTS